MSIENLAIYGGLSTVFGLIKAKLKGTYKNLSGWIFSVFVSISVGVLVGSLAESFSLPQGLVFALVSAAAITAESLVFSLIDLGEMMEKDPLGTINELRGITKGDRPVAKKGKGKRKGC